MKPHTIALLLLSLLPVATGAQMSATPPAPQAATAPPASAFDRAAPAALQAMRAHAETLKVAGVALLAYFESAPIQSWSSRMLVVGSMKHEPTASAKGDNLLAVAYAKAAEMADTLKDSGSQVRPPMTGEVGWQGGVIVPAGTGYLIAAFSGGQSADDVAISRAGIGQMQKAMPSKAP